MAKFPSLKRLFFNPKSLVTKAQKDYFNVHDALVNELVQLGVVTKDPCCDCVCGYDLSGVSWTSATLNTWVVDGTTYNFDLPVSSCADVINILNNSGFGHFTFVFQSANLNCSICIPQNDGHVYGAMVVGDVESPSTVSPECPLVIIL